MYCVGFSISKDGLHASKYKIEAIVKIRIPKNVSEVKAFIEIVNYYSKFTENLTDKLYSL